MAGRVIEARDLGWEDVALTDAATFVAGLRQLDLPEHEVEEATSLVSEVAGQLSVVDREIEQFNYEHRHIRYFMTPSELQELYTRRQGVGAQLTTYPLAQDKPGDAEKYAYDYEQSRTGGFSVGAKAFGADLGFKAEITLTRSVGLEFELRGGHDYEIHSVAEGQGIAWKPA